MCYNCDHEKEQYHAGRKAVRSEQRCCARFFCRSVNGIPCSSSDVRTQILRRCHGIFARAEVHSNTQAHKFNLRVVCNCTMHPILHTDKELVLRATYAAIDINSIHVWKTTGGGLKGSTHNRMKTEHSRSNDRRTDGKTVI